MKIKAKIIALMIIAPAASQAGTIITSNIQNADGDIVLTDASGVLLSTGIVSAGYFTTGFDVSTAVLTNDFVSLYSNFISLTSGAIGQTTLQFGSDIAGFFETPNTNYGAPTVDMLGKTLYSFFGDGATLNTSSQFALVQFAETIDADTPLPDANDLNLFVGAPFAVLIGSTGGTASVDLNPIGLGTVTNPTLALVPEPSVALLGAFGVLGLLRRRR